MTNKLAGLAHHVMLWAMLAGLAAIVVAW